MKAKAQVTDTTFYNYGIWQYFSNPVSSSTYPEIRGRLCNFLWRDIEPANNVWNWVQFDSNLAVRTKDKLPVMFTVFTKEDAPDWLFTNGVPKVDEKDDNGTIIGYAPYYVNANYKLFFKRMITAVRQHVESLPDSIRRYIIAVQPAFGSTGDYISYKGKVAFQYKITSAGFLDLFKEFSLYYYNEYKNTNPKIYLLHNPGNTGDVQTFWLIDSCGGGWIKTGNIGKAYQLNDETIKAAWLYNILNIPQKGNYIRARAETAGLLKTGWWLKKPYQNMFTILCYAVHWGLDWSNQSFAQIGDSRYDSTFAFFNKYAGMKDPVKSTRAMCALKDAIDAADSIRFPASSFGPVEKTASRFSNVLAPFTSYGALLEDAASATGGEAANVDATGINDVGWNLFPGNYERYLHQLNANQTSAGYWNVASSDPNIMYGRFARGFDLAKGKNALYFDVDNTFLNNAALNGAYPVIIDIIYLDEGTGSWQFFYDAQSNSDKPSLTVTCSNSRLWKKASVVLNDAHFDNSGVNASDFYIKSTGSSNVIFAFIELTRPEADLSDAGFSSSALPSFDTICVNSISPAKSFTLEGSSLTNPVTIVGPANGYVFSDLENGTYDDSLIISNYQNSFSKQVYIKFQPVAVGSYSDIPVKGGGVPPITLDITGVAVQSNPSLSTFVTDITCNGNQDGNIDLTLSDGTGPFTYSWINNGNIVSTNEDINGLSPGNYSVTVTANGGCTTSASAIVNEPPALSISVSKTNVSCRGGNDGAITISAAGGTAAYQYSLNAVNYQSSNVFSNLAAGTYTITVKDANDCKMSLSGVSITQPSSGITVNLVNKANTSCNGGSDGSIKVNATKGTPPYTFSLNGGAFTSSNTFSGLKAGTYTVTGKDSKGCTSSISVSIANGTRTCRSFAGANTSTQESSVVGSEQVHAGNAMIVQVVPNPSPDVFTLNLRGIGDEETEITVTDVYGKKVYRARGVAATHYTFGKQFAAGMYMVQVIHGRQVQRLKIIKH